MSLIDITHLSFTYEGSLDPVFSDLNLSLDTNWRTGLIGRNGRGKTTLLRLLLGELAPAFGHIQLDAPCVRFPCAVPDLHARAFDVACALSNAPDWQLLYELSQLGLEAEMLDRPYDTLSPGERTRLQLAALFLNEGCYPLIDEPTNHLDMEGRALCARYLARQEGFLLVSHDRAFLDASVDHIVSINRSSVETQRGNYSSFAENRRRQNAFEQMQNEKLGKQITHLQEAARRTAGWSDALERTKIGSGAGDRGYIGAKSAKMMQRAKATEKRRQSAIDEQKGLLNDVEREEPLKLFPLTHRAPVLIEARDLTFGYGDDAVQTGLRFSVERGSRVAVTGGNGSGKSTLIKIIAGASEAWHTGLIRMPGDLRLSYVPQDTAFLTGLPADYARACGVDLTRFLTILRKLSFPREAFDRPMERYSDGQRKKVLLARSLSEQAHLYLWDEPLNYIDLLSRVQLEELILAFAPSLLLIEHDRKFVETIATERLPL